VCSSLFNQKLVPRTYGLLLKHSFCPTGELPNNESKPDSINPNGNTNKCLDIQGDVLANGTPAQV
jgi:hypothetical protein